MKTLQIAGTKVNTHEVVELRVLQNKSGKFQYVNLSSGHICPCEFDNIQQAFADLGNYLDEYEKLIIFPGN